MQQTMREVLRAVASLSGVELPGLPPGLQDDEGPAPRLDVKTLKDRFRNDLEGFSIKTTEELTKRAKEQTHAALDAVQNEIGGWVDQVSANFREQLELPAQIGKLVEPCVTEAVAKLEGSLSQKFEQLVVQHEQLVQERLQGTLNSVQAQISMLEQTVQQIREMKPDSVAQSSADQLSAAKVAGQIDQIAAEFREKLKDHVQIEKLVEPRIAEAVGKLEGSLSQKFEKLVTQHEQLVQERLQGTLSSVQAQISTLEQTVQQVRDLKADSVAQPSAQLPSTAEVAVRIDQLAAEIQEKLQDQMQIEKLLAPRVAEAVGKLEGSLSQKFEHLVAEHEHLVQDRLQGTLSSVQAQIGTLEQTVQQVRQLKADSVVQVSAERPAAAADNATKEPDSGIDNGFNGYLDQAFSRIESSFSNLLETSRMQPGQGAGSGIKGLHSSIPFSEMDRERRVQQALDDLDRLGTKNPHPVS